jgi:hypothetical protein
MYSKYCAKSSRYMIQGINSFKTCTKFAVKYGIKNFFLLSVQFNPLNRDFCMLKKKAHVQDNA